MESGRPLAAFNARATLREQISGVERWAHELSARLPGLSPGRYAVVRPPSGFARRAGQIWEQTVLPATVRRLGTRLLLCPANTGPIVFDGNVIVMHDALPLRHPEWYSTAYALWHRRIDPLLVRRARLVITVSRFSASELVETTGADPQRIAVVHGGVDERFSPAVDASAAQATLDLGRPYVLAIGGPELRKNAQALEPAARRLSQKGIELVAVGRAGGHIVSGRVPASVRTLGYVPDEFLPAVYAGAAAFVLPSLYEGFGLPALEAMASGVPVVAADRTALPEICGDAALLVDVDDPAALNSALDAVLGHTDARKRLIDAGLQRARAFTWDRTARSVDALVRQLAEEDGERADSKGPAGELSASL